MEFCTTRIGDNPILLHFQVAEAGLVDDPWDEFRCILWRDEVLEVPSISLTKDGMGKEGEGGEGIE